MTENEPSATHAARDRILAKVRKSLAVPSTGTRDPRTTIADNRIQGRRRHLIPERATRPANVLRAEFTSILQRGKAIVVDVETDDDLPAAVAGHLRGQNLAPRLRMGADPRLAALPWGSAPQIDVGFGAADPTDLTTMSYALAAAAETGTLMLASGPDNPVTLSFLPDNHLVALSARSLVGSYEDAFDLVREALGPGVMPRTLNLISGPSRTSDIGGKTVMGAHGPRSLTVFIVG